MSDTYRGFSMMSAGAADEHDWSWTDGDLDWIPPDIDTSRPSSARMYDYALGGKDNFEIDRAAVQSVTDLFPDYAQLALANRGFLVRSVDAMARSGIDQFIDLGAGIPTSPNVHQIATLVNPDARVVYVDNDPIVTAHNRALRGSQANVRTLGSDLRHPDALFGDPVVRDWLDLSRPVGVLFIAVLHFVRADLAPQMVARYRRELAPGSQIAMSVACSEGTPPLLMTKLEKAYADSATPIVFRSQDQIEELLADVDLAEPGVVDVTRWRHQGDDPTTVKMLAALGTVR
jgi:hypothetical protein